MHLLPAPHSGDQQTRHIFVVRHQIVALQVVKERALVLRRLEHEGVATAVARARRCAVGHRRLRRRRLGAAAVRGLNRCEALDVEAAVDRGGGLAVAAARLALNRNHLVGARRQGDRGGGCHRLGLLDYLRGRLGDVGLVDRRGGHELGDKRRGGLRRVLRAGFGRRRSDGGRDGRGAGDRGGRVGRDRRGGGLDAEAGAGAGVVGRVLARRGVRGDGERARRRRWCRRRVGRGG